MHTLIAAIALISLVASSAPAPAQMTCPCDCNRDAVVRVSELVSAAEIAVQRAPSTSCPAADGDGDGTVTVGELVAGARAALSGCDVGPTPTPGATPTPEIPPIGEADLLPWLRAEPYRSWPSEPQRHPSTGPHFGDVRTFVNDTLFASLLAGSDTHPVGSAAVKELFGRSGDSVRGWSVSVKLSADSDGGNGWYWYERFGSTVFADGLGERGCTGCHGTTNATQRSRDFVLSPSFSAAAGQGQAPKASSIH